MFVIGGANASRQFSFVSMIAGEIAGRGRAIAPSRGKLRPFCAAGISPVGPNAFGRILNSRRID